MKYKTPYAKGFWSVIFVLVLFWISSYVGFGTVAIFVFGMLFGFFAKEYLW